MEKTKSKTEVILTPNGNKRFFVEDGDEINYTAWAGGDKIDNKAGRVGFGECRGLILPAIL